MINPTCPVCEEGVDLCQCPIENGRHDFNQEYKFWKEEMSKDFEDYDDLVRTLKGYNNWKRGRMGSNYKDRKSLDQVLKDMDAGRI